MNSHTRSLLSATLLTIVCCSASAQQQASPGVALPRRNPDPDAAVRTAAMSVGDTSPAAMEVLEFERKIEAAVVAGDVDYVSSALADDFVMVHGDAWATGNKVPLIDNKQSFLKRVQNKQYLARDLDSVKVEMHGDIAITYGKYRAESIPGGTPRSWFAVWFERVYARRNGKWMYLSHRTVHGPTYGPDKESLVDK